MQPLRVVRWGRGECEKSRSPAQDEVAHATTSASARLTELACRQREARWEARRRLRPVRTVGARVVARQRPRAHPAERVRALRGAARQRGDERDAVEGPRVVRARGVKKVEHRRQQVDVRLGKVREAQRPALPAIRLGDKPGGLDHARYADAALEHRALAPGQAACAARIAKSRRPLPGGGVNFGAVVGREDDHCVIGKA